MIEYFRAGGPVMWPLLAAALAGIAVVFERIVILHRMPTPAKAEKQLDAIEQALTESGIEGAAKHIAKGKGVLNYVFARLIRRYDTLLMEKRELKRKREEYAGKSLISSDPVAQFLTDQNETSTFRDELLMTVDDATKSYVERFLPALSTVVNISPLMGLLGTVTGMIKAFESIATSGTGDPRVVASGISEALITTATGLIIAVPATVFYRYLVQKAESSRSSIEIYAVSFSDTLLAMLSKRES